MTVPSSIETPESKTPESPVSPIGCALSDADLSDRVRAWARVGRQGLVSRRRHPQGIVLRYRRDPEIEAEVRELVSLEHDCCAFLAFESAEDGAHLVLTVSGPPEAASLIQQCWGLKR